MMFDMRNFRSFWLSLTYSIILISETICRVCSGKAACRRHVRSDGHLSRMHDWYSVWHMLGTTKPRHAIRGGFSLTDAIRGLHVRGMLDMTISVLKPATMRKKCWRTIIPGQTAERISVWQQLTKQWRPPGIQLCSAVTSCFLRQNIP